MTTTPELFTWLLERVVEEVEALPTPYRIGNGVHGCPTYAQHKAHLISQARKSSRTRKAHR